MKVVLALYFSIVSTLCVEINKEKTLNILGIFPFQGRSHFIVFETYLKELAQRGHNVTVISYFPQKQTIKNYHDISLAEELIILEDEFDTDQSYWSIMQIILILAKLDDNCKILLANENVQQLWKTKAKFDVVVTDQFISDCPLGLAYVLDAPVVGLTSHTLMPWHFSRFGVPLNPSYVSHIFLNGGKTPSLVQRLERVVFNIFSKAVYKYINQRMDQHTLAQYFEDLPPLEELARNVKFLLHYTHFIYSGNKIFPPNIIEVGGHHVTSSKILADDLRKFVEEAEHGVIYISFGTVIKSSSMPSDICEAILGAIRKLPQRFIWKYHNETLLVDRNKLYIANWLPQVDILGHSNTRAFVSHAGMAGITEALHFGVPIVAMPVLGDQPSNAAAVEESGIGVRLESWDWTTDNIISALKTVMEPEFRAKVKLVSKAWHDRPMSPLDTAIYWTEYAARYPNFTFRTAAADVPWYRYIHLDIALLGITFLFLLGVAIKAIISYYFIRKHKVNKKIN